MENSIVQQLIRQNPLTYRLTVGMREGHEWKLIATRAAAQWLQKFESIVLQIKGARDNAVQLATVFDDEVPITDRSFLLYPNTRFALPSALPCPHVLSSSCRVVHSDFQAVENDDETLEYPETGTWTTVANKFRNAPSAGLPCTIALPSLNALNDALIGRRR